MSAKDEGPRFVRRRGWGDRHGYVVYFGESTELPMSRTKVIAVIAFACLLFGQWVADSLLGTVEEFGWLAVVAIRLSSPMACAAAVIALFNTAWWRFPPINRILRFCGCVPPCIAGTYKGTLTPIPGCSYEDEEPGIEMQINQTWLTMCVEVRLNSSDALSHSRASCMFVNPQDHDQVRLEYAFQFGQADGYAVVKMTRRKCGSWKSVDGYSYYFTGEFSGGKFKIQGE